MAWRNALVTVDRLADGAASDEDLQASLDAFDALLVVAVPAAMEEAMSTYRAGPSNDPFSVADAEWQTANLVVRDYLLESCGTEAHLLELFEPQDL